MNNKSHRDRFVQKLHTHGVVQAPVEKIENLVIATSVPHLSIGVIDLRASTHELLSSLRLLCSLLLRNELPLHGACSLGFVLLGTSLFFHCESWESGEVRYKEDVRVN
nr:hypothetical protein Itr_chr05CG12160 [Ipomoea trifida]